MSDENETYIMQLAEVKEMWPDDEPPSMFEIERLAEFYPTFKMEHRAYLISDVFIANLPFEELYYKKLKAKGLNEDWLNKRRRNCHKLWIPKKTKRGIIRIIYLRYRIDQNLTRKKALPQINHYRYDFGYNKAKDQGQSSIAKHTRNKKTDEKIDKFKLKNKA